MSHPTFHSIDANPTKPKVWLWMSVCVLGMIAIKAFLSLTGASQADRIAGLESGDIAVDRDILSLELNGWKCVEFQSPQTAPETNKGTFWWSHHWMYARLNLRALVAFDQAGWTAWHELTECYQSSGWKLTSRTNVAAVDKQQRPWNYVIATFDRPQGQGVLLFSEFFEDGTPVEPGIFSLQEAIDWAKRNKQPEEANDLAGRFAVVPEKNAKEIQTHDRVLQCQVLLNLSKIRQQWDHAALEALHLRTREQIRTEWTRQVAQSPIQTPLEKP